MKRDSVRKGVLENGTGNATEVHSTPVTYRLPIEPAVELPADEYWEVPIAFRQSPVMVSDSFLAGMPYLNAHNLHTVHRLQMEPVGWECQRLELHLHR